MSQMAWMGGGRAVPVISPALVDSSLLLMRHHHSSVTSNLDDGVGGGYCCAVVCHRGEQAWTERTAPLSAGAQCDGPGGDAAGLD